MPEVEAPVKPMSPPIPRREDRPYYDPDTVREPETWCPTQKRRGGFEGI